MRTPPRAQQARSTPPQQARGARVSKKSLWRCRQKIDAPHLRLRQSPDAVALSIAGARRRRGGAQAPVRLGAAGTECPLDKRERTGTGRWRTGGADAAARACFDADEALDTTCSRKLQENSQHAPAHLRSPERAPACRASAPQFRRLSRSFLRRRLGASDCFAGRGRHAPFVALPNQARSRQAMRLGPGRRVVPCFAREENCF